MKTLNLANLHMQMEENGIKIEESMGHMEDNIERIVKLIEHQEETDHKEDDDDDKKFSC